MFTLKMDVICCNCDFVYGSTALQLQQKSDLVKSGSSQSVATRYPNPISSKNLFIYPWWNYCKNNMVHMFFDSQCKLLH